MPWRHKGSGGIALLILSHGSRWRSVVNFMLCVKSSQYDIELGARWALKLVCFGEEKSLLSPMGVEPQIFSIIAYSMLVSDV